MDGKCSGSIWKGLVPVIPSCIHSFPTEVLQALTLGRCPAGTVENSGEGLPRFPGFTAYKVRNHVQETGWAGGAFQGCLRTCLRLPPSPSHSAICPEQNAWVPSCSREGR